MNISPRKFNLQMHLTAFNYISRTHHITAISLSSVFPIQKILILLVLFEFKLGIRFKERLLIILSILPSSSSMLLKLKFKTFWLMLRTFLQTTSIYHFAIDQWVRLWRLNFPNCQSTKLDSKSEHDLSSGWFKSQMMTINLDFVCCDDLSEHYLWMTQFFVMFFETLGPQLRFMAS